MADQPYPTIEETRQVRFAVVMYGGVSLAIYINGVTQELFKLVRSTARLVDHRYGLSGTNPNDLQPVTTADASSILRSTERVYRKIAYLLSDPKLFAQYDHYLEQKASHAPRSGSGSPAPGFTREDPLETAIQRNQDLHLRFIIDILSGTSAGGINAVFLAKALANNLGIQNLKTLWLEQGDIAQLINDGSLGAFFRPQEAPQSLLNSQYMYVQLLRALTQMERPSTEATQVSDYIDDDLDLFITATDLEGTLSPLKLSGSIVKEKRHRHAFHLYYKRGEQCLNDFEKPNNPLLAFIARCTSALPFAFEPMCLIDIDATLADDEFKDLYKKRANEAQWQRFFAGRPQEKQSDYVQRPFGDGGYLDNKPFGYAIETMISRQPNLPTDRKLIYIEPSPEVFQGRMPTNRKPDVITHTKLALVDLPTYETIREDLQRLDEHNRLVNRVNRITSAIEHDINSFRAHLSDPSSHYPRSDPNSNWRHRDLAQMIKDYGVYYLPYRRLIISAVTNDIADIVARNRQVDLGSTYFHAVRSLVRAWRDSCYYDSENDKRCGQDTVNGFIYDYDLNYRLRRLLFLIQRIDFITQLLDALQGPLPDQPVRSRLNTEQRQFVALLSRHVDKNIQFDLAKLTIAKRKQIKQKLTALRSELANCYQRLFTGKSMLASREVTATLCNADRYGFAKAVQTFHEKLAEVSIDAKDLNIVLGITEREDGSFEIEETNSVTETSVDEEACVERAQQLYRTLPKLNQQMKNAAQSLQQAIGAIRGEHSTNIRDHILTTVDADPNGVKAIVAYLRDTFVHFEEYDQIRFPIFYQTDYPLPIGEADIVEVHRISPEDAISLINEKAESKRPREIARPKLTGTAYGHFGAFLSHAWRKNDIMWGRLDGAERLITALLPDQSQARVRHALIEEANLIILEEELLTGARERLAPVVSEAMIERQADSPLTDGLQKAFTRQFQWANKNQIQEFIDSAQVVIKNLQGEQLLQFAKDEYRVNRALAPEDMLRNIARLTAVGGNLVDQIAKDAQFNSKATVWLARASRVFLGLVEVALPNRWSHLVFRHFLGLLYLFWAVLIVFATFLGFDNVQKLSVIALFVTLFVQIATQLLGDVIQGRRPRGRFILAIAIVLVLLLAGGVYQIYQWAVRMFEWINVFLAI